jgi:hypothetical protein
MNERKKEVQGDLYIHIYIYIYIYIYTYMNMCTILYTCAHTHYAPERTPNHVLGNVHSVRQLRGLWQHNITASVPFSLSIDNCPADEIFPSFHCACHVRTKGVSTKSRFVMDGGGEMKKERQASWEKKMQLWLYKWSNSRRAGGSGGGGGGLVKTIARGGGCVVIVVIIPEKHN